MSSRTDAVSAKPVTSSQRKAQNYDNRLLTEMSTSEEHLAHSFFAMICGFCCFQSAR